MSLLLLLKGGGVSAQVTQWLEYTAPDRKPDFIARKRTPDYESLDRKPDFTAPKR